MNAILINFNLHIDLLLTYHGHGRDFDQKIFDILFVS